MQKPNKEMTEQEKIYAWEREQEFMRDLEFVLPFEDEVDEYDESACEGLLEEE